MRCFFAKFRALQLLNGKSDNFGQKRYLLNLVFLSTKLILGLGLGHLGGEKIAFEVEQCAKFCYISNVQNLIAPKRGL